MFEELVGIREQLTRLTDQPASRLGQAELQSALGELHATAGLVAGLVAGLAHDLDLRGAAIMLDPETGASTEVEAGAWLGRRLAADRRQVRGLLRRGRRLQVLDTTRRALLDGRVSVEQADAIAVIRQVLPVDAHPDAERLLLAAATRGATPDDLGMLREQIRHRADPDGSTDAAQARFDARQLTLTEFGDGSLAVRGKLDPVAGAQVLATLRAHAGTQGEADTRTPSQRMADALHHVCTTHVDDPQAQRRRPEIIALVPLGALTGDLTAPLGRLADSTALLSPVTVAGLGCTAGMRRLVLDPEHGRMSHQPHQPPHPDHPDPQDLWDSWAASLIGLLPARLAGPPTVLDLGRSRRLATDDQWAALLARDGGCVYPGCTAPPSMTEIHHLAEWAHDHGPTDLDLLALLCRHHHHDLHHRHQKLHRDHHGTITITSGTSTRGTSTRGPTTLAA